jgi:hypothetical protein
MVNGEELVMARRTSVELNFVERGEGVPVLALHGWTPDHRLMLGCLERAFTERPAYRRLYPDLPGMGRTTAPPSIASSDDVLDAVQDFVEDVSGWVGGIARVRVEIQAPERGAGHVPRPRGDLGRLCEAGALWPCGPRRSRGCHGAGRWP